MGGQALTSGKAPAPLEAADVRAVTPGSADLPTNYGLESSWDSYLNAQGVDVGGAYAKSWLGPSSRSRIPCFATARTSAEAISPLR